jgi:hypothetical protein
MKDPPKGFEPTDPGRVNTRDPIGMLPSHGSASM